MSSVVVQALTGKHAIPPANIPICAAASGSSSTRCRPGTCTSSLWPDLREYPAEGAIQRKSTLITREMLCELLVQLIVVCYHNTPPAGPSAVKPRSTVGIEVRSKNAVFHRHLPTSSTATSSASVLSRTIGRRGITIAETSTHRQAPNAPQKSRFEGWL